MEAGFGKDLLDSEKKMVKMEFLTFQTIKNFIFGTNIYWFKMKFKYFLTNQLLMILIYSLGCQNNTYGQCEGVLDLGNENSPLDYFLVEMDKEIVSQNYTEAICHFESALPLLEKGGSKKILLERLKMVVNPCLINSFYQANNDRSGFLYSEKVQKFKEYLSYILEIQEGECELSTENLRDIGWAFDGYFFVQPFDKEKYLSISKRWVSPNSCVHDEDKLKILLQRDKIISEKYLVPPSNNPSTKSRYIEETLALLEMVDNDNFSSRLFIEDAFRLKSIAALRYAELYHATLDKIYLNRSNKLIYELLYFFLEKNPDHQHNIYNDFIPYLPDHYNRVDFGNVLNLRKLEKKVERQKRKEDAGNCDRSASCHFFDKRVRENINRAIGLIHAHNDSYYSFYYFYAALHIHDRRQSNDFVDYIHWEEYQADKYYHRGITYQWLANQMKLNFNETAAQELFTGVRDLEAPLEKILKKEIEFHTFLPGKEYSIPLDYHIESNIRVRESGKYNYRAARVRSITPEPPKHDSLRKFYPGDYFLSEEGWIHLGYISYELIGGKIPRHYKGKKEKIDIDDFVENLDLDRVDTLGCDFILLKDQLQMWNDILDLDPSDWRKNLLGIYESHITNQINCLKGGRMLQSFGVKNVSNDNFRFEIDGVEELMWEMYEHSRPTGHEGSVNENICNEEAALLFSQLTEMVMENEVWVDLGIFDTNPLYYGYSCTGDSIVHSSIYRLREYYLQNLDRFSEFYNPKYLESTRGTLIRAKGDRAYLQGDYETAYHSYAPFADSLKVTNHPAQIYTELEYMKFPHLVHACIETGRYGEAKFYAERGYSLFLHTPSLVSELRSLYMEAAARENDFSGIITQRNFFKEYNHYYPLETTMIYVNYIFEKSYESGEALRNLEGLIINGLEHSNDMRAAMNMAGIMHLSSGDKKRANWYFEKAKEFEITEANYVTVDNKARAEHFDFMAELYISIFDKEPWSSEQIQWLGKNIKDAKKELNLLLDRVNRSRQWEVYLSNYEDIIAALRMAEDKGGELNAHYLWFTAINNHVGIDKIDAAEALDKLSRMNQIVNELNEEDNIKYSFEISGGIDYIYDQIPVIENMVSLQHQNQKELEELNESMVAKVMEEVWLRERAGDLADSLSIALNDSKRLKNEAVLNEQAAVFAATREKLERERSDSLRVRTEELADSLSIALNEAKWLKREAEKRKEKAIKDERIARDSEERERLLKEEAEYFQRIAELKVEEAEGALRIANMEEKKANRNFYLASFFFSMVIITLLLSNRRNKKQKADLKWQKDKIESQKNEMTHRVVNNLKSIKALIRKRIMNTSGEARQELSKVRDYIISSLEIQGLIRETMTKKGEYRLGFINRLVEKCAGIGGVSYRIDIAEDITLGYEDTYALSVIINEVITNSTKHAFHGVEEPEVYVELKEGADSLITLEVGDNGNGIPDINEVFRKSYGKSLGMTLIRQNGLDLNPQEGVVIKNSEKGMSCRVVFNVKKVA